MIDQALRRRLLALAAADAATRDRLAADGSLFEDYHPEMRRVHEANADVLRRIVDRGGWPDAHVAGTDGAEAAWLVAQHAIGLPDFQLFCLVHLEAAAAEEKVPAWQPAYLTDRIHVLEGRPQLYGTQFDWDEAGEMSPVPIEDAAGVDARRAAIGLPPMAEAIARQREAARAEPKPTDPAARRERMDAWAHETGWRRRRIRRPVRGARRPIARPRNGGRRGPLSGHNPIPEGTP